MFTKKNERRNTTTVDHLGLEQQHYHQRSDHPMGLLHRQEGPLPAAADCSPPLPDQTGPMDLAPSYYIVSHLPAISPERPYWSYSLSLLLLSYRTCRPNGPSDLNALACRPPTCARTIDNRLAATASTTPRHPLAPFGRHNRYRFSRFEPSLLISRL